MSQPKPCLTAAGTQAARTLATLSPAEVARLIDACRPGGVPWRWIADYAGTLEGLDLVEIVGRDGDDGLAVATAFGREVATAAHVARLQRPANDCSDLFWRLFADTLGGRRGPNLEADALLVCGRFASEFAAECLAEYLRRTRNPTERPQPLDSHTLGKLGAILEVLAQI